MLDITSIMKKIDSLKPIPQIAHKIMSIVEDPESSLPDLSKVIGYDSAVTANLLKVANSAYFGRPGKFDSVHQAIVYLGMDHVVDLVLLASGADNLKPEQTGYDLQKGDLWKYSVLSALIARELAENKGIGKTHLIFTAALLKDIGKVILENRSSVSIMQSWGRWWQNRGTSIPKWWKLFRTITSPRNQKTLRLSLQLFIWQTQYA